MNLNSDTDEGRANVLALLRKSGALRGDASIKTMTQAPGFIQTNDDWVRGDDVCLIKMDNGAEYCVYSDGQVV